MRHLKLHTYMLFIFMFSSMLWGDQKQGLTFDKVFPKDTLLLLSFPDIERTCKELKNTNLYELINEPEIERLINITLQYYKLKDRVSEFSKNMKIATGLTLEEAVSVINGELSIALVDIPSGSEPLELAVILQFKDCSKEAHQLLDALTRKIPADKGKYKVDETDVSFIKGLETALHYTTLEDRFLFTTTESLMRRILGNLKKGDDCLSQNPKFQRYVKKIGAGASILFYLDLEKLFDCTLGYSTPYTKNLLNVSGITDWQSLGMSLSIQEKQFLTQCYIGVKGEFKGINKFFSCGQIDTSIGKCVPADACFFVCTRIDASNLWQEFLSCYEKIDSKSFLSLKDDLEKFERAFLGFSIDRLLKSIGPDYTVFQLPDSSGGLLPRWIGAAKIEDSSVVLKAIDVFTGLIDYQIKSKSYKERNIYYLALIPEETRRGKPLFQLAREERDILRWALGSLSFFFDEGKIFIGRLPQDLMDLIDYYENKSSSLDMTLVSPIKQRRDSYGILAYIDLKRLFPPLYNTVLPFIPALEEGNMLIRDLPVKASDLPRISTVTKHISPSIFGMEEDKGEIVFSLCTNFSPEFPLVTCGAMEYLGFIWGPTLFRFIEESDSYLRLNALILDLTGKERFYESYQRWKNFGENAYFESFRSIADKEAKELEVKYYRDLKELRSALEKSFPGSPLSSWQIEGDWKFKDGILSGRNTLWKSFSMICGENPLSDYMLEFEVKNIKNSFNVLFNWQKPFGQSPIYENISFPEIKGQSQSWIPLKFKVHKDRITYWFGLKHYVVSTSQNEGMFGFELPPQSEVEIRDIRLTVPKKVEEEKPKFPIIYIDCVDTADPVEVGDKTRYIIMARNEGGKQATNVMITFNIPPSVEIVTASGLRYEVKNNRVVFGPTVINPNQTLKCEVEVQAMQEGSASSHVILTFAELQGEIVVTERTHILK